MSIAFYGLSIVNIITSLFCIILWTLRKQKNNLVFNKQYFWSNNVIGLFSSVLLFVFCYQNEGLETLVIFAMMATIALIANIVWYNEIIVFEDKQFVVRNFCGYKKRYNYSDVTGFYIKKQKYRYSTETTAYFFVENKKFSVLTSSYNYASFFAKLNFEYKEYNKGKKLPKLKALK